MCGQAAFSSAEPFDVNKIKTLMLWNSLERGIDSTGLYSPKNGLKKSILKGSDFITAKSDQYGILPDNIFMAHLRQKTVGAIKAENAHPFKRGDWVLQHNGTLTNHYDLINKYDLGYANYDVDSDVICGALEKTGDILTVLSEIDGPAALVIQNTKEPNRLYVFKNKERPLFKGYIGSSMYISSIENSLTLIGCTSVKEFKDDYLYVIEDGLIVKGYPKEIKSNPYTHTYKASNYAASDQKYVGTILRMPYTTFAHWPNNQCKFNGGDLVEVTKVTANYATFKKLGEDEEGEFYIGTFLTDLKKYFIEENSLCRALYEIYMGKPENVLIKAGDVVVAKLKKVNDEIDPKNINLHDEKTNKKITYCDRSYFIKLTVEEVIRYHNANLIKPENDFVNSVLNDNLGLENPFVDEEVRTLTLVDDTKEQDEEFIPDDEPIDNFYDDLDGHFKSMDEKIEKLRALTYVYFDSELTKAIADLDDENFKAHNKFIFEDEEN